MDMKPVTVRRTTMLRAADYQMTESGNGRLEGVPVKYRSLNDRGECFLPGAYADDIPNFLEIGFNCDSHEWNYRGVIGYPVEARETEDGLVSTFEFHSTADAQDVRTKIIERRAAGKAVCLSQGFQYVEYFDVYPNQYAAELPKYLRESELPGLMAYAKQFPRIRIVRKARIFEWSIVTAGSQEDAMATEVRSAEERGQYLGDMVEAEMTIYALSALNDALFWRVLYPVLYDETRSKEEKLAILQGAVEEYSALFMSTCESMLAEPQEAAEQIRQLYGVPEDSPANLRVYANSRLELRMVDHSDAVLAAVSGFVKRMERARSWRSEKRAGRELSEKNIELLKQHRDAVQSMLDGISTMLEPEVRALAPDAPAVAIQERLLKSRLATVQIN